jgi:hypothetical protein
LASEGPAAVHQAVERTKPRFASLDGGGNRCRLGKVYPDGECVSANRRRNPATLVTRMRCPLCRLDAGTSRTGKGREAGA